MAEWTEEDYKRVAGSMYLPPPLVSALERAIEAVDPDAIEQKAELIKQRTARKKATQPSVATKKTIKPKRVQTRNRVRKTRAPGPSEIETAFDSLWQEYCSDLPAPVKEYKPFHDRRHRIDNAFVLPGGKLAIEVEGFGHGMRNRYAGDLVKYNRLAAEGWILLRCDRAMLVPSKNIEFNPKPFFDTIRNVIERML